MKIAETEHSMAYRGTSFIEKSHRDMLFKIYRIWCGDDHDSSILEMKKCVSDNESLGGQLVAVSFVLTSTQV